MMKKQNITQKDIAERAGVGQNTVSRVVTERGYVSPDVRRKIEDVMEELGYCPDRHAQALRARRC